MDKNMLVGIALGVGLPALIGIIVALFGRFLPKQETYDKRIRPVVQGAARALSKLLRLKLGAASADKIEEGVFVTIAFWVDQSARDFIAALTEDHKGTKNG